MTKAQLTKAEKERFKNELTKRLEKEVVNATILGLTAVFLNTLNEEFDFGTKRLERVKNRLKKNYESIADNRQDSDTGMSIDDVVKHVENELKVSLEEWK